MVFGLILTSFTLCSSKLEIESLKEYNGHLKEAAWAKDSEAARCRQCEREFTLARRKVCVLYL